MSTVLYSKERWEKVNEENKELFLNELDLILPLGLIFSHEYENGKLKVIFKEVQ